MSSPITYCNDKFMLAILYSDDEKNISFTLVDIEKGNVIKKKYSSKKCDTCPEISMETVFNTVIKKVPKIKKLKFQKTSSLLMHPLAMAISMNIM